LKTNEACGSLKPAVRGQSNVQPGVFREALSSGKLHSYLGGVKK